MVRLTRSARGAVIALALALFCAAPAAAAQPTRTVSHPTGGLYPADQSGCGFDIRYVYAPGATEVVTDYSDGSEAIAMQAVKTLTNVATGKTLTVKSDWRGVVWLDAANGVYRGTSSGQQAWSFLPGDMGPYGLVEAPGMGVEFVGTVWWSFDATTFVTTQFAYKGTITDVCALLS